MPIEFRCSQCGKLLRTGDETAGRQAQCPACSALTVIPDMVKPAGPSVPGLAPLDAGSVPPPSPPRPAGLSLPQGPITPTPLDFSDVLSRTWSIFQKQWAMCLVAILMVMAISFAVSILVMFSSALLAAVTRNHDVFTVINTLGNLASSVLGIWLGIGMRLFFLKIARGQPAEISTVFAGWPYFWRILGASILIGLIVLTIAAVCILPTLAVAFGIMGAHVHPSPEGLGLVVVGAMAAALAYTYVMLMLSQFSFLILDRDVGVIESFTLSAQLMRGNKLTLFLIWLVTTLVSIPLVLLTCFVGFFAVAPFLTLMAPVIYLTLTGQPTADQLGSGQAG